MTIGSGQMDETIKGIATYVCDNPNGTYEISFPEGDRYICLFSTDDYEDNDEEPDSPGYEEWYTLDFKVAEVATPGPNKDPEYGFISISRKRMPSLIVRGDEVVYRA